jgi:selenocysteine-specific elongation factor
MDVIVGTAGHIDHGKTALVKALTGVDADRLPEEKRRGITIDLGFAETTIDDVHFGFVDVPGHERFVKNMLAGASGIDLVVLVVAADEGVMPQTREHFDICRLLGVDAGLIALTKADLVDADTLDIARLDVAELVKGSFLENAPVIAVSSKTGFGVDELRSGLVAQARIPMHRDKAERDHRRHVTRLPIDRSFSMKGFGAVATGTLASGEIAEGDELELLPDGKIVRVRGLQSHGKKTSAVESGRRVAVNLGGVDHADVIRGMTLVEPDVLHPTQSFDAEVEVLRSAPKPLRSRQRVRLHIGTAEVLARVQALNDAAEVTPGGCGFVQLRLESPIVAVPGERFVIRSYSPQITIAGGAVIDNDPPRHRRKEFAKTCDLLKRQADASADPAATGNLLIEAADGSGLTLGQLAARTGFKKAVIEEALRTGLEQKAIVHLGARYFTSATFEHLMASAEAAVVAFHKKEPLARGMPRELLRESAFSFLPADVVDGLFAAASARGKLVLDKENVRLRSHSAELSAEEQAVSDKIFAAYKNAGLEVQKLEELLTDSITGTKVTSAHARKFLRRFLDAGEIVKVTDEFYFSKRSIDELKGKMKNFADTTVDRLVDVPKFKDIAGVSRKYAIPLLEYFDREHVTARVGDKRVIL